MQVANHELTYAKAVLEGQAKFEFVMEASLKDFEFEASKILWTFQTPPVAFTIGPVPFKLQGKAPISIGLEAEIKTEAELKAQYQASMSIEAGYEYSRSKGWSEISDVTLDLPGKPCNGKKCTGKPCAEGQCRSQYGWCGVTEDHCNSKATWKEDKSKGLEITGIEKGVNQNYAMAR